MASVTGGAATTLTTRQAAFIGVGAMVGAGIFSLLGAAGEVAGAAVWVSFLIAGIVAGLQGYSFAKFGSRYPSAGGLLEYVAQGLRRRARHRRDRVAAPRRQRHRHRDGRGVVRELRQRRRHRRRTRTGPRCSRCVVVVAMTLVNILGSQAVAKAQTVIVYVVLGILTLFAVTTLANLDLDLLAFSGYPPLSDIVASVALTFFAFLGFGVVTFTAKDLADPSRQLSRAIYLALGIATTIYVAVALGVFGTLTVDEVIDSGGTALAVAAEPVLGRAGYWLMTVTALFATSGATNSGLYPAPGLCEEMAAKGQFPPVLGRRFGGRAPAGLLLTAAIAIVLAVGLRPQLDRLDRQRHRAARVHAGRVGHLRVRRRDRGAALDAGAGHPEHRRGAGGVHLHHARRRARDGRDPGRDHRC